MFRQNYEISIIKFNVIQLIVSHSSVSYENWLEHTKHLKREAENELSDTYTLRETMHVAKEKSKHEIRFQQDTTDYALRRRSFASQKARNELEWQKLKVMLEIHLNTSKIDIYFQCYFDLQLQKEMENLRKQIGELESALRAKTDDVKCVETRLENRTYRPGFELCQDEPEFGLKDELLKLQETKEELSKKIDIAQ